MLATDFEYDGAKLSDFGCMICEFDSSSGASEISIGSEITFNTVSKFSGKKWGLASTQYDTCIEASFSICKNACDYIDDMAFTSDEFRKLVRWLNRREFLKIQFLYEDEDEDTDSEDDSSGYGTNCHYYASFNISKITINGIIYGAALTMITNAPFGYAEEVSETLTMSANVTYSLTDTSDEIGYIYPSMVITCKSSGTLTLTNSSQDCSMEITNCTSGEVITIDGDALIISSSSSSHDICNNFNFDFFKIGNTYDSSENSITSSLACTIVFTYEPIIKMVPD